MRKLIIDTDTASDDAVALVLALRDPSVQVIGITTLAGNVPLQTATNNALISIGMANTYAPPVYMGNGIPLVRDQLLAQQVHGEDGLGDVGYQIPEHLHVEKEHAVDALARMIKENDDVELVTLGPLTNVAMAVRMYPEIMKKVKNITAMGGQYYELNPHWPASEFNILVDPEAVDIVLRFGIHITFVPLDVCMGECEFNEDEIKQLYDLGTTQAKFFVDCNRTLIDYVYKKHGTKTLMMPDPTAMAYYLHPELANDVRSAYVQVETKSPMTVGQLLYDFDGIYGQPVNGAVVPSIDIPAFKKMIMDCCK